MNAQQRQNLENNAARLAEVKERIQYFESQKEVIQSFFKSELGKGTHVLGDHVVTIGEAVRSSHDIKRMTKELGSRVMEKFARYTPYLTVKVKKSSTKAAS